MQRLLLAAIPIAVVVLIIMAEGELCAALSSRNSCTTVLRTVAHCYCPTSTDRCRSSWLAALTAPSLHMHKFAATATPANFAQKISAYLLEQHKHKHERHLEIVSRELATHTPILKLPVYVQRCSTR